MNKTFASVAYAATEFTRLLANLDKYADGFTIDSDFSETPTGGICVAVAATQGNFGPVGALKSFAFAVEHSLRFGGWLDPQTGKFYFDAVRVFKEEWLDRALTFARDNDQLSVFRLSDFTTFNLPTNFPDDERPVIVGQRHGDETKEVEGWCFGGTYYLADTFTPVKNVAYWREKETEVKPDLKPSYPANTLPNDNRYINITFKSGRQIEGFYEGGEYLDENADHIDIESISHWQEI